MFSKFCETYRAAAPRRLGCRVTLPSITVITGRLDRWRFGSLTAWRPASVHSERRLVMAVLRYSCHGSRCADKRLVRPARVDHSLA